MFKLSRSGTNMVSEINNNAFKVSKKCVNLDLHSYLKDLGTTGTFYLYLLNIEGM